MFVDTGGWYAHLVSEDSEHVVASRLFDRAIEERWALFTTDAVVFETYALLINRARNGQNLALDLLSDIAGGLVTMVHVTEDDVAQAMALVESQRDKSYSLCDASSFVVMERLRIQEAIAFDDHFRQYGRVHILQ